MRKGKGIVGLWRAIGGLILCTILLSLVSHWASAAEADCSAPSSVAQLDDHGHVNEVPAHAHIDHEHSHDVGQYASLRFTPEIVRTGVRVDGRAIELRPFAFAPIDPPPRLVLRA